jgi:transcription termination/antitermination protein NusG
MSVQEPRDQFERESMEEQIDESVDSSVDLPLSDSDSSAQSNESESVDVPTDELPASSSDDSALDDELDQPDVPAIKNLPLSSSGELPPPEPTEGPAWYVIHCYSGYENKVRHNLEQRIETMGMKDKIFDVVIPTQEEIEVKDGKRRTVERHIFPGYVLVNMALTEESWYVVRNTPGVTGFVGMGNNPTPLRPEEVAQIVKRMEAEAPTVKVTFKVGERVRIVDGPFNDFRGIVSEIDMERTKVRVMVSFFGRETPVELDFLQVEKA